MDHIYDIKQVLKDKEYKDNLNTSDISIGHVFFEQRRGSQDSADESIRIVETGTMDCINLGRNDHCYSDGEEDEDSDQSEEKKEEEKAEEKKAPGIERIAAKDPKGAEKEVEEFDEDD